MFEKYDIVDLYLASIIIAEPEERVWDASIGQMVRVSSNEINYNTVIRKVGDHYVDLKYLEHVISEIRNSRDITYLIEAKESLWHYEVPYGRKKITYSRNKALKIGERYYPQFNKKNKILIKTK